MRRPRRILKRQERGEGNALLDFDFSRATNLLGKRAAKLAPMEDTLTLDELLQKAFEENELSIDNTSVRENFRSLVVALLWIAFRARRALDHKLFRMLVLIEYGFTHLLATRRLDG